MYGNDVIKEVVSGSVLGAGLVVLPQTSGNTLGTVLAFTAIGIGVVALLCQLTLRVMRHYSK